MVTWGATARPTLRPSQTQWFKMIYGINTCCYSPGLASAGGVAVLARRGMLTEHQGVARAGESEQVAANR